MGTVWYDPLILAGGVWVKVLATRREYRLQDTSLMVAVLV